MDGGGSSEGADAVLVTARGTAAADGDPADRDSAAVIVVTYCFDAESWLDRWGTSQERAVAVSAGERSRSAAAVARSDSGTRSPDGPGGDPVQVEAGVVETVPSKSDVGAVGAAVHEYLDEWDDCELTVYVDSLGAIVDATDSEVTFRLVHALVARAQDADARVVAAVGEGIPPHVEATFAPLFDRVV
ncbi:DUF7504 family protein [Halobacterium jilantaiense]|nr:hypothetical protein [Halobacterium jilantaiense]